jgi:hypothetical protein
LHGLISVVIRSPSARAADPAVFAPASEASAAGPIRRGSGLASEVEARVSCPAAAQGGSADGSAFSSVVRFPARRCSPLLALTCVDGG